MTTIEQQADALGQVEFKDNNDLHAYTLRLRKILRILSQEAAFAADELQARLATVPGAKAALGIDSRIRARIVAAHLRVASDLLRIAAGQTAKCYAAFLKHYAPELDEVHKGKPRPSFRIVEPGKPGAPPPVVNTNGHAERRARPAQ